MGQTYFKASPFMGAGEGSQDHRPLGMIKEEQPVATGAARGDIHPVPTPKALIAMKVCDVGLNLLSTDGAIRHELVEAIHQHRFREHWKFLQWTIGKPLVESLVKG